MQNFYNPRPSISILNVRTSKSYKMSLDHRELPKVTSSRFQPQFLPIGMPQELSPQIPMAIAEGMLGDKISGQERQAQNILPAHQKSTIR